MRIKVRFAQILLMTAICLNTSVGYAQSVLTLPENLKEISDEAFAGLQSVSEIIVPDGVITIGNAAFRDCSALNSVTIPMSVTSIGESAFLNCSESLTIHAPANSYAQTYASDNGYAFVATQEPETSDFVYTSENGESIIRSYTGSETGTLNIPAMLGGYPVTSIASSAFFNCSASRVVIPQGVRTVSSSSFAWCTSLTSVVIPESVTQISSSAFQNCHMSLVLEGQPGSAAEAHARLYGLGFMNASTGELLFDNDYGYMIVNGQATLTAYNTHEEHPELPTELDGYPVTAIGDSVLWNNNWVKSVNIPQGIQRIGSSFLSYCYSLTEVTLPKGLTSIGTHSMNGCPLLTSITIPNSVTSIGMGTFSNATEGFTIYGYTGSAAQTFAAQNSIAFESIDETPVSSFTYTIADEQVTITRFTGEETEIVIPKEIDDYPVTALGSGVFSGCTSVTQIKIPESVTVLGDSVFSGCTALAQVNIPDAVTEIGASAFNQCTALKALALPKGLNAIGSSAFAYCTVLTQIIIPEGTQTIGSNAFTGCSMLSNVRIAQTVTSIGTGAFDGCSASLQITGYANSEAERYSNENHIAFNALVETDAANFTYTIADGEVTITGYTGSETQIMIPRYIDGYIVTTIGDSAFELSNITRVVLQDSITTIGRSAFYWCKDLLEIYIPESVTDISYSVFSYAHSDLKIIGSPDSVAQTYAWDNAIGFVDEATGQTIFDNDFAYTLNNGRATLTRYTGDDETLVVPATIDGYPVERVMSGTMQQADYVKTVSFAAQITEIERYLLANCDNLSYVKLPDSATLINERAFSGCYELERIDIPASVTSIDPTAFNYCDRITIYGAEGSYAQTFAHENGIAFKSFDDIGDGFTFVQEEDHLVITGYTGTQTELVIPAEINYMPLSIGTNAFENNTTLTSITISEGIKEIGASAFEGCTNLSTLTLSSSLTRIGNRAFARCENLEEVILPAGVTTIEASLFEGCRNLRRIDLPDTVTQIGAGAFASCSSLNDIILPSAITTIADNTFKNCTSLTAMVIPQSVTTIGNDAYAGNTMLSSIVIPSSVTSIGTDAFNGCSASFCMTVDEGSYAYTYAVNNNLAYKINTIYTYTAADGEVTITGYDLSKSLGEHMIIPETLDGMPVTSIADDAFTWSSYITTSLTLPHTVRTIGARAFTGLSMLESVVGTGVTSIGDSAFSGCNKLTNMPIHEGLTKIGTRAFSHCLGTGIVTLPASLTEIGDYAFVSCTGIEAVTILSNSASFGTNIFDNCTGISSVVFEADLTEIPVKMFYGCAGITSLSLPAALESIGNSAFARTTALCEVDFPETLSIIGESAFSYSGLETLELPENLTIGHGAFTGIAIRTLNIPQSTVAVGAQAFSHCANLTQINLPTQPIDVNTGLFNSCTALTSIDLSSLEWEYIPKGMFGDCTSLRSIILPSNAKYMRAEVFDNCTALESVIFGDQLLQIEEYAFRQCYSLKTIELPESLLSLKEGVFRQSGLTQIRIPDSVVYLAKNMFYDCTNLEHVEFGTGSKIFYEHMITFCPNLREVIFYGDVKTVPAGFMAMTADDVAIYGYNGTAAHMYAQNYNYTFHAIPKADSFEFTEENGEAILTAYLGDETFVCIPESYNGMPVTQIASNAFRDNKKITHVVIPATVTSIGGYAFEGCFSITSVTIKGSNVEFGGSVFSGCECLMNINIPYGTKKISAEMFRDCYLLSHITIPSGVTKIDIRAFGGCAWLKEIIIPDSVTRIESDAFRDCNRLETVRIGEGLTTLGDHVFAECPELRIVELPVSLTSISYNVFTGSENVTVFAKTNSVAYGYAMDHNIATESTGTYLLDLLFTYVEGGVTLEAYNGKSAYVQIPSTVQGHKVLSIAPSAFESNKSIHTLVIDEGIQSIGEKAFADCTGLTTVTLPSTIDTIDDYAFADSGIKNLVLPAGITTLGNYAFSNCSKLQSVRIPATISSIGKGVFHTCKMLEQVRFAGAVPAITAQMFAECDALEKITIPSGTPSIGTTAFYSCEALKEVRIPDSVTTIDPTAFTYCSHPPIIFGTAGSAAQAAAEAAGLTFSTAEYSSSQGYLYTVNNERATIISYNGYSSELTIPQELDDYPVVAIAAHAFENNTRLISIDTGKVASIGAYAFSGCTSLASITLHDGLAQIGDYAFANTAIKQISLPDSVTTAGAYTFSGCSALQNVNMSSGMTSIGAGMFNGCTALESLMISSDTASIGAEAFSGCTNLLIYGYSGSTAEQYALANGHSFLAMDAASLDDYVFTVNDDVVSLTAYTGSDTTVRIPYQYNGMPVTDIADSVFYNNDVIKRVIIPDTVTRIGAGAFADCAELESIKLPSQLRYVEDCAFQYSPKLTYISLPYGTKSLGESVFTGCTNLLRIDVPSSVVDFSDGSPFRMENYIIYTEAGAPVIEHAEKYGFDYFYIDLENEQLPQGNLFAGDNFVFQGSLQSSMPLNRARIVVTNQNTGRVELAVTWTIVTGVKQYDLAGFTTLGIENLPLGKYRCDFYAETDLPYGTETRHLASSDFRIIEASLRIACMSGYQDPGAFHMYGEPYKPVGELHATKYIDSAYVTCINTETNETFRSDTLVPQNSTRVIEMSELHESLNFAALELGEYNYFITVIIEGTAHKIQPRKFRVVDYSSQLDPALTDALAEFCYNPDNVLRFSRYSGDYKDVLYGIDKWDEIVIGAGASNVVIDNIVGLIKGYPGGSTAFAVNLYEKQLLQNLSALVAADALSLPEETQSLQKYIENLMKLSQAYCGDIIDALDIAQKNIKDTNITEYINSAKNTLEGLGLAVKFTPAAIDVIAIALGDYQEIILTLNKLSSTMGSNASPEFKQAVTNLYVKYSNAATNVLETLVDYLLEKSITEVTEFVLNIWKGGSLMYLAVEWTRDLLFKISGVQDISDNALLFITQMNLVIEYTDSYRTWFVQANEELANDILNPETLERVYFMHDATKQALIDLYDIMLDGYSKEHRGSVNVWKSEKASLEAMTWL